MYIYISKSNKYDSKLTHSRQQTRKPFEITQMFCVRNVAHIFRKDQTSITENTEQNDWKL